MLSSDLRVRIIDALHFSHHQVRRLIQAHPNFYPLYTHRGRWKHDQPAWTHWCDGFLPGMMWLFLESSHCDNPSYWRSKAEEYSRSLEHRKEDREVHDLGFLFFHGAYKSWYEATLREGNPDPKLNDVVIRAGEVLAMRFKEKGQYLRSFISDESCFIDIMMNVPIIFYAARELSNLKSQISNNLTRIASAHCATTIRTLIRGDGSTAHEGLFNTETGELLRQSTHQGYRGDSCWSRGLAWSLYGFGTCYELTQNPLYLNTAERHAEYYIAHTPADGVPPWDYDAPTEKGFLPDSSAAAIAAVGLLNLSRLTVDPIRSRLYRDYALNIVNTLTQPPYLAKGDPNWEGILKCGVYHIHKNLGVDESVMWGEFFFVQALVKSLQQLC